MWEKAGLVRTAKGLREALAALDDAGAADPGGRGARRATSSPSPASSRRRRSRVPRAVARTSAPTTPLPTRPGAGASS